MTELEQLLSEALASQSEHVASLAERLTDLTAHLEAIHKQQLDLGRKVHWLMSLVVDSD